MESGPYLQTKTKEDLEQLKEKREPWHKFYYKVPPQKSPKLQNKIGFERKDEESNSKKTVYIHHFLDRTVNDRVDLHGQQQIPNINVPYITYNINYTN